MVDLKLGILGISEGNGHPYSWAAIFNGYNPFEMKKCGFPVIPDYLSKQKFPDDTIVGAKVTSVWTQSSDLSNKIARAAQIKKVCNSIPEMIPDIDAVLLARDDSENHLKFAREFIEAGLPIFIDKPLATSVTQANKILSLEKYVGQIFSCSACRYAREFDLSHDDLNEIGKLKKIIGYTPNSWQKYAVHLIEPILKYIPKESVIENKKVIKNHNTHTLNLRFNTGLFIELNCVAQKKQPIELTFVGEKGIISVPWQSTFDSFKKSLQTFISSVRSGKVFLSHQDMLRTVELIEMGNIDG